MPQRSSLAAPEPCEARFLPEILPLDMGGAARMPQSKPRSPVTRRLYGNDAMLFVGGTGGYGAS